jgi:hypothetical protein
MLARGLLARVDKRRKHICPNLFPRMITTPALFIERTRALLGWKWRAIPPKGIARTDPSHAVRSDAIVAVVVVEIDECVYSTVQEMGYLRAAACMPLCMRIRSPGLCHGGQTLCFESSGGRSYVSVIQLRCSSADATTVAVTAVVTRNSI